jgi:1,2-phenylacetyl-CoA epoxidase catalytic subunit
MRIEALKESEEADVAALAEKIDREEAYHRMHAELWHDRLRDEPRYREALDRLWPYALGMLPEDARVELARRVGLAGDRASQTEVRGSHTPELAELWKEMTSVRRSVPGAQW